MGLKVSINKAFELTKGEVKVLDYMQGESMRYMYMVNNLFLVKELTL
ncbi:hypothetical protein [Clostridium massiliamazoniense]|nr:hypothetical protein [Clostridium massiliamazoniense]